MKKDIIYNTISYRFVWTFVVIAVLFVINVELANAFQVVGLPSDNLIKNPWFRTNNIASLEYWVSATGEWSCSQKESNPTPTIVVAPKCDYKNVYCGTAARVSPDTGGICELKMPALNKDIYIYQVVSANPANKTLKYDASWVSHIVTPAYVSVFASESPNGPWTKVWQPFYYNETEAMSNVIRDECLDEAGAGGDESVQECLWKKHSALTDMVQTTLSKGYPYYKIEIHASVPTLDSGFKITGVYFATSGAPVPPTQPPVPPVPPVPPEIDPRPGSGNNGHGGKIRPHIRTIVDKYIK